MTGSKIASWQFDNVAKVHRWPDANRLCLNPDKSEAKAIGIRARQRQRRSIGAINVSDVTVPVSEAVRSLGVATDNTLSFSQHFNDICQAAHFHVTALRYNRRCVPTDDAMAVAVDLRYLPD